jgi:xylan 1,4-beta-xylosidase
MRRRTGRMRGFDASLFHDGAQSWLLNLVHDWRPGHGGSAGLEATRYDRAARRLAGEPVPIALPPLQEWVEGPSLYRRGPWYYLLTADGGTGYQHQVTVARSRSVAGPYERDPRGPLVTARHHADLPLQKAGHGSLVETGTGQWYLAYLTPGRTDAAARACWAGRPRWPLSPGHPRGGRAPPAACPPSTYPPLTCPKRPGTRPGKGAAHISLGTGRYPNRAV